MTWKFPIKETIECPECGEEFDIVLTSEDSKDHPCPKCSTVATFDFKAAEKLILKEAEKAARKAIRRFK